MEQVLLVSVTVLAAFVAIQAITLAGKSSSERAKDVEIAELKVRLHQDPLTGLQNRAGLEALLSKEYARASRTKAPLSVLFVDIDHFKMVNDTYGHQAGDTYLQEIASFLKGSSRAEETVTRLGGEEFVIVLVNADIEAATNAANRYRGLVEMAFVNHPLPTTISIGIASLGQSGVDTAAGLVMAADGAMYRAKAQGRNRCVVYNETIIPMRGGSDG